MACRRTGRGRSPFRAGLGVGALAAVVYVFVGPHAPWRSSPPRAGAFLTPLRASLPDRTVLQGVVLDPQGRALPAARVSVRPSSEDCGDASETWSEEPRDHPVNHRGSFAFTDLEPGTFEVVARAPGFRSESKTRVLLGRTQPAVNLRFVLQPAE